MTGSASKRRLMGLNGSDELKNCRAPFSTYALEAKCILQDKVLGVKGKDSSVLK